MDDNLNMAADNDPCCHEDHETGEVRMADLVSGKTYRWRGSVPGGSSMLRRMYEESNRRALERGYAK